MLAFDGLVLLDLPDVDSPRSSHRLEAERLVELFDVFVWVTDPQKYADALLHDKYVVQLTGHSAVMLVVLNQVDRLSARRADGWFRRPRRILDAEGLPGVPVVPASARTGKGCEACRQNWESGRGEAGGGGPVVGRLDALAQRPGRGVRAPRTGSARRARRLDRGLDRRGGSRQVVDAVERNHRLRARQATGWPFTRWVSRLRPDPARRRLRGDAVRARAHSLRGHPACSAPGSTRPCES